MKLPLAEFPIVSTIDADHAQQILSRELADLHFESVRNRDQFQLNMNGTRLGRCLIAYNQFGTETKVDAGVLQDSVIFSLSDGNPTYVQIDGETIDAESGVAISPENRIHIHRTAGSGVYFVRISYNDIKDALREMTDYLPQGRICFAPDVNLTTGFGAQISRLLRHFAHDAQHGAMIANNTVLGSSYEDLLINSILQLPHTFHELVNGLYLLESGSEIVQRAEEYLAAHAASPVTISDVVRECCCSRRSLFNGFRRHRGYSPMQFLTERRMLLAHELLATPHPDTSVATVAADCGFGHMGRFAAAYRKRFGENPSVTLQHQRDRAQRRTN